MAYEYIFNNFTEEVSLEIVADVVKMHPSAFSRFFKQSTCKRLSGF